MREGAWAESVPAVLCDVCALRHVSKWCVRVLQRISDAARVQMRSTLCIVCAVHQYK
jgi:hypothetical protein